MLKETLFKAGIPRMNTLYQELFSKGKSLRSTLTIQIAKHLELPKAQQESLGRIVEYIHQSSILHDDVIDASPIRRQSPSIWRQYSMKKSILAGDYLLAEAGEEVAKLKSIPILEITSHTLKQLVKGEWLQAEIKNKETEESVQKVHTLKTASLFQWSVCAPFLLKGFKTKPLYKGLNKIGRVMGLLFQRADDLLDFDIRNKEGKTAFKDLEEGFFNSFALHLLKHKVVDQKSLLQKCRSLKDLKQLTAKNTPALFNKTLKDFDAISQQMITQSEGEIQHLLEQQVEETCIKKALKDLKKWPKKLYWRT